MLINQRSRHKSAISPQNFARFSPLSAISSATIRTITASVGALLEKTVTKTVNIGAMLTKTAALTVSVGAILLPPIGSTWIQIVPTDNETWTEI